MRTGNCFGRRRTFQGWKGLGLLVVMGTLILGNVLPARAPSLPIAQDWTVTGSLDPGRQGHTATLLPYGQVLVAGGLDINGNVLYDCQIYNPSTGLWTQTGPLATARCSHTATLLANGQVLVAGGQDGSRNAFSSCEIYDPNAGLWTQMSTPATGGLNTARFSHTATLLQDGTVLVAGGEDTSGHARPDCEIYDPNYDVWTTGASLNTARFSHTATLLQDGTVLVAGGEDTSGHALPDCEIYDPTNPGNGWTPTTIGLNTARMDHTATLLNDGTVLVAGGQDGSGNAFSSYEIYDPNAGSSPPFDGTWTQPADTLHYPRYLHTATLLQDGTVLVAGGMPSGSVATNSSEIYDPNYGDPNYDVWTTGASLNRARYLHTATLLQDGTVLAAGGVGPTGNAISSCEIYNETQQDALISLYNSTGGLYWWNNSGWGGGGPVCDGSSSNWYGVGCESGNVVSIELGWNNLSGIIPASIGNLTTLTSLDLSYNSLSGPIPASIVGRSMTRSSARTRRSTTWCRLPTMSSSAVIACWRPLPAFPAARLSATVACSAAEPASPTT